MQLAWRRNMGCLERQTTKGGTGVFVHWQVSCPVDHAFSLLPTAGWSALLIICNVHLLQPFNWWSEPSSATSLCHHAFLIAVVEAWYFWCAKMRVVPGGNEMHWEALVCCCNRKCCDHTAIHIKDTKWLCFGTGLTLMQTPSVQVWNMGPVGRREHWKKALYRSLPSKDASAFCAGKVSTEALSSVMKRARLWLAGSTEKAILAWLVVMFTKNVVFLSSWSMGVSWQRTVGWVWTGCTIGMLRAAGSRLQHRIKT